MNGIEYLYYYTQGELFKRLDKDDLAFQLKEDNGIKISEIESDMILSFEVSHKTEHYIFKFNIFAVNTKKIELYPIEIICRNTNSILDLDLDMFVNYLRRDFPRVLKYIYNTFETVLLIYDNDIYSEYNIQHITNFCYRN